MDDICVTDAKKNGNHGERLPLKFFREMKKLILEDGINQTKL